ncbi:autophagy-related protein 9A-like [Ornithodoros turicata]
MSGGLQTAYQALPSDNGDAAETPQESSFLIHLVPDSGKTRWNHVEDLDTFFTRVYHYHQKHGFACMMIAEILELVQFLFVVLFTTFLVQCVDYPVLFKDKPPASHNSTKVTLSDVVIPIGECAASLNPPVVFCLVVAFLFWILRAVKVLFHLLQFVEIRAFYINALKISSNELDNMTWHQVQCRLLDVQKEQQMCIHKLELTELDIYHRILRYKNYMVAMVNKDLLPLKFQVPFLGEVVFLSQGLKYNLELILFWGPWAPFENNWHLKEDYKRVTRREVLAKELSKHILWVGLINLLLLPVIFLWQLLYSFFSYAELVKREPGFLGSRMWSLYGRLYLRHFNELDHELNARLCRGYRPALQYMNIFTSHLLTVIARSLTFFAGSVLAVLLGLTVYDEDVITVESVLTIVTVLGMVVAVGRNLIPDEHLVWCPERLMQNILAHLHYIPDHWSGQAHTYHVRDQFAHLFQYKAVHLLGELMSPLATPLVLCLHLRHRALEIVDFLRNFTVEVVGVGDVCSFAQMDVRKHGNPQWHNPVALDSVQNVEEQAEHGKTELSLMHFTLTNPKWVPPQESTAFLSNLREQVERDAAKPDLMENPLYYSLHSLSSLGAGYSELVSSVLHPTVRDSCARMVSSDGSRPLGANIRGGISFTEGPHLSMQHTSPGLLTSLVQNEDGSVIPSAVVSLELTAANMSFSTLYMHELHRRQLRKAPQGSAVASSDSTDSARLLWQRPTAELPDILESPQEGDDKMPLVPVELKH